MVNQATTVMACPLSEGDQNKIIREKGELEILIVNLPPLQTAELQIIIR